MQHPQGTHTGPAAGCPTRESSAVHGNTHAVLSVDVVLGLFARGKLSATEMSAYANHARTNADVMTHNIIVMDRIDAYVIRGCVGPSGVKDVCDEETARDGSLKCERENERALQKRIRGHTIATQRLCAYTDSVLVATAGHVITVSIMYHPEMSACSVGIRSTAASVYHGNGGVEPTYDKEAVDVFAGVMAEARDIEAALATYREMDPRDAAAAVVAALP